MISVVVDLDGTLFNHDHRVHLAHAKQWDTYHALLTDDKVNPDVEFFLNRMVPSWVNIVYCTGRSEPWRNRTIEHMRKSGVPAPDALLMRPHDNWQPDHELKPKMLEQHFGGREMTLECVMFVLDDRDKVVEAWRNYGLPCWQVRSGGF